MILKIFNNHGNVKRQIEVKSVKEAEKIFNEYKKATDTGYLYIQSSMRIQLPKPKYKRINQTIIKNENGRILSKREIANGVGGQVTAKHTRRRGFFNPNIHFSTSPRFCVCNVIGRLFYENQ